MTRRPAPTERPVVLTVAGSDSGGGAGIQADLKTIEATGGFGTSAVTAVTAQNTTGVESSHILPTGEVGAQLEAVLADFDVAAAKTGMLATAEVVETVIGYAREWSFPLVVDPVMVAATGDRLLSEAGEAAYEELVAEAMVVTPNADEAGVLTGVDVDGEADQRLAGQRLCEMGADAALVKGGHVPGETVEDVLVRPDAVETVRHPRVDTDATHGSGCALAAAIATRLGRGESVPEAVRASVAFLGRAVRYHHDVGRGPGAVHHLVDLRDEAAREPIAEQVREVVARFVERDVGPLVPEVGMNVVGATPYAESVEDCAAVEGRITCTMDGARPSRGVRFGASSHVARFLLAAREHHPDLRWGVNCRFDDRVEAALEVVDAPVAEYDRADEPEDADGTMDWAAEAVFGDRAEPPAVVLDRGAHGKEPIAKFVGRDAGTVAERVVAVCDAL